MNEKISSPFKLRATAVAVACCLSVTPWVAEAAGLGKITVLSGLGQPLRAEVDVSASREELAGMTARLAPAEVFRQAGVDYTSPLLDLRFSVEKRGSGQPVIKVSSGKPVNEPFLDFLVELNWPTGRLVREYTFLLDPPEVAAKGMAVSVAEAKPVAAVKDSESKPEAAPRPAPRAAAEPRPKASEAPAPGKAVGVETRVVKGGDTLRKIAVETQPAGVSLEQMLVGLFRANSEAFVAGNMHRLKAGAILNIPDKDTVAAVSDPEARKVIVSQTADWNAYRQKLASGVAKGPAKTETASQSAGGRITARVDDKASAAEVPKDRVKVSPTEAVGKGGDGKGKGAKEEELVAKDKALKEAQERLASLEKNVSELQKLVELKSQNLAELQKQATSKKPEETKPVTAEPIKPAIPPKAVEAPKPPEPVKAVEPPKPVEPPKVVEPPKPAEAPAPVEPPKAVEAPKPAEEPKPVVEAKPAEPAKPPPPPKKPIVLPEPEPEPSFMSELLDSPWPLVGGAGGILALIGGYVFYKRRRGLPSVPASTAIPSPASLGPNSVFRATGGQSVDTGNVAPQSSEFSQTGPGTIDTDEVDPVAEADVYMAYGRDAQAEEILLEALQKDPQRTAIHAKLLEIYANRKSLKQFETLATELYAQTGGVGAEWEKVCAMGGRLDPENPLYSGAERTVVGVPGHNFDADATVIVSPKDAVKTTVTLPGTLGQMAHEATAVLPAPVADLDLTGHVTASPAIPVAPPVAEVAEEPDLMSLDFDLGRSSNIGVSADQEVVSLVEPEPVFQPMPEIAAPPPAVPQTAAGPVFEDEDSFTDTLTNPENNALDFELAGRETPVPTALAPASPPEPDFTSTFVNPDIVEPASLDFDLALDDKVGMAPAAAVTDLALAVNHSGDLDISADMVDTFVGLDGGTAESVEPLGQGADGNMLDFDLDIAAPAAPAAQVSPAAPESAMGAPLDNASDVLDIGAVDADALEFDVKLTDSTILGQPMDAQGFDLGSINLDLAAEPSSGIDEPAGANATKLVLPAAEETREEVPLEQQTVQMSVEQLTGGLVTEPQVAHDASWEEINTKLDLAKAYEEMGDLEGAKELLQEVVFDGPEDLAEEARAILARVST